MIRVALRTVLAIAPGKKVNYLIYDIKIIIIHRQVDNYNESLKENVLP